MRKDLFGEQAFLPLTVDGALLADDHVALAANIWQALPDDLGKRAVVHYDPSRMANPVRISSDSVVSNNPAKSGFISFIVPFLSHRCVRSSSFASDQSSLVRRDRCNSPKKGVDPGLCLCVQLSECSNHSRSQRVTSRPHRSGPA